ncbi:Protein CBG08031 [Caenorhabditis briggsae]|uniref:Protein CBG08030 n=1 Tax=Caenorhabditis briggsae TaxID=6238 RepID=G2J6L8_CAEBR|nr:Protein CBG08030 [Caenorhabditis briggsae]XP_002646147.1 Protein CBG08031 [Caenorhabditis briggsae]CAP27932.1 Protein CBG08030 [Caenorhabditis briggsae]CAP27933.1 Protein CBG08031 [Caenorhabditis briggsae]
MSRSKCANRAPARNRLKRTSYLYVKGAESEHVAMKENAGTVLLKQKKKKTPAESSVFVNRCHLAEVNEVEEDAEDTLSITDYGYSGN